MAVMILSWIMLAQTKHLNLANGLSISCIFSSIALLNMSDMSSFSNILKGSLIKAPTPAATSTFLLFMLPKLSPNTKSSNSLLEIDLETETVQLYMIGEAFGGGGGGRSFLLFFGAVGSVFSQRPKPIYLYFDCTSPFSVSITLLLSPLGPAPVSLTMPHQYLYIFILFNLLLKFLLADKA